MSNQTTQLQQINVTNFSLEHTIDCGQFFLYEKNQEDDFYYIIENDKVFKIKQPTPDTLLYSGTPNVTQDYISNFFSLDEDLLQRTKTFKDPVLTEALEIYWGLRNIRQDLFQCMIGFVCSSASNIPKIKNNLRLLCKNFGTPIKFEGNIYHTFPTPEQINNLELITECKTGYRAKFIYSICQSLQNNNNLEQIKTQTYLESQKSLMEFMGIGIKVADCICLFALSHKESFPVDTWIKQIIQQMYLDGEEKTLKEISQFIQIQFKENKGLAQQYLFHWARFNLKKL
jgi:N-glycosylase/DNA lyase